jgi:superfamily II DNA or RNA helicase
MTTDFHRLLQKVPRAGDTETAERTGNTGAPAIFFQISHDRVSERSFLRVTDAKGKHQPDTDYRRYSGRDRSLLRALESVRRRRSFIINWERDDDDDERVYLDENESLLFRLRGAPNIVDEQMNPVAFPEVSREGGGEIAQAFVELRRVKATSYEQRDEQQRAKQAAKKNNAKQRKEDNADDSADNNGDASAAAAPSQFSGAQGGDLIAANERIECRAMVRAVSGEEAEPLRFLTEQAALARFVSKNDNGAVERERLEIVEIAPLGENYAMLPYFNARIAGHELERFLSLLASAFPTVPLRYENYRFFSDDEPIHTSPSLIFEKVDEDNTLYLRVAAILPQYPQYDPDFLSRYEVSRIARLNDLERTVHFTELVGDSLGETASDIETILRKTAAKQMGKALAKSFGPFVREGLLFIIPGALAEEFIRQELQYLIGSYTLLGAERLKSYKIRAVHPKLQLSLSSGIDFLEGDASLSIEGETFSLFDAISQYRKQSYITLSDGTQAIVNARYIAKLERIFTKKKNNVKLSFFDLPLVEELIDDTIASSAFQTSRAFYRGFNDLAAKKAALPSAMTADLRPYQEQGYKWLQYLYENNLGGCLADDMGLGKTLQAIGLLSAVYPQQPLPSLVVMPKSLLFNWEAELKKFNASLTFYTYYGATRDIEEAVKHNIVMTTYAMLRNDIEIFKERLFHIVILDEAQNVKNLQSQTSKAVMLLQAEKRFALSGTPIENNLGELYALFRFLNPAMFGSTEEFSESYAAPIQKYGDKEAIADLRKKIYPFILRRLKKDVLAELPGKIEQTLLVDMSPEQAELYEARRLHYYESVRTQVLTQGVQKSQFAILQALSELRQIASIPEAQTDGAIVSPKREALMEQLEDVVSNGRKALVFANFLAGVEAIAEECEKAGIRAITMTGATRDRKTLVEKFQNDPDVRVFIMTLKTGGLGLNLTAADTIFLLDPWWNAAAESQAIDRAHRMGQTETVFSYKLVARGTIEEKILQLQERKKALFDTVISSDSASLKSLDEADIDFILGDGRSATR